MAVGEERRARHGFIYNICMYLSKSAYGYQSNRLPLISYPPPASHPVGYIRGRRQAKHALGRWQLGRSVQRSTALYMYT